MTSLKSIESFLSQEHIAVAGVSRNSKKFGTVVYHHLKERGKKPTSQSYMWIQKGGPPGQPAVRYHYAPSRGHEVPIIKSVARITVDGRDKLLENVTSIADRKALEEDLSFPVVREGLERLAAGGLAALP